MAEQTQTSAPAGAAPGHGEAEELRAAREEILRLRDLLVGKDAELGAAKGRLAELEDHSQRLVNAASRVHSRLPAAIRTLGAALRKLRRS